MANFESAYDLKVSALQNVGEVTNGNSEFDSLVLPFLVDSIRDVQSFASVFNVDIGEDYPWARNEDPGLLTLQPKYETGTIAITEDSTTATLSSAPAVGQGSFQDWFLKIEGREDVWRITAHTAGNDTLTLDQAYTDATGTGLSYFLFKIDYALTSGIQRLFAPFVVHKLQEDFFRKSNQIHYISKPNLERDWPLRLIEEKIPTRFSVIKNLDGLLTVRFNGYVKEKTRVEYDYVAEPRLLIHSFVDSTVDTGADDITITNHLFEDNDLVMLHNRDGAVPTGLLADKVYYVVNSSADDFQLAATLGGSAIDITAATGGGTHYIASIPKVPKTFRRILAFAASHFVAVQKSDSRLDYFFRVAQQKLQALAEDHRKKSYRLDENFGRILPRADLVESRREIFRDIGDVYV